MNTVLEPASSPSHGASGAVEECAGTVSPKPLASSLAAFDAILTQRGSVQNNPRNAGAAAARMAPAAGISSCARDRAASDLSCTNSTGIHMSALSASSAPTAAGAVSVSVPPLAVCVAQVAASAAVVPAAAAPPPTVLCAAPPCASASAGQSPSSAQAQSQQQLVSAHVPATPVPRPLRYQRPPESRLLGMADKRQLLAHLTRDDYKVYRDSSQRVEQQHAHFEQQSQAKPSFQLSFNLKSTFKEPHVRSTAGVWCARDVALGWRPGLALCSLTLTCACGVIRTTVSSCGWQRSCRVGMSRRTS
jgi:hypothetical protein